jgi:hypothetical protein
MSDGIKPAFANEPPSDRFVDLIVDSGAITDVCEFCGRTFFEDDENKDWNEGEYERLKEWNSREPDKCVGVDQIRTGILAGKRGVVGCPCNWATPYENFIWSNRQLIMSFISKKVKDIVEDVLKDESSSDNAMSDLEVEKMANQKACCVKCRKFKSHMLIDEKTGMCRSCIEETKAEEEAEAEKKRQADKDVDLASLFGVSTENEEVESMPF